MKQFANEKEGPAKKPSGGLDRDNQNSRQDKKNQEFGGFGTSGGNGYADPMEAAQFGHPGAMAMLQSGGGLGQKGPRPIPGHLVVKAQRLLGADLSGVTLEEDPFLAEQGKRGVAEDGQRIRLVPGGLRDMKLIWHEMVHIVQQQKAQKGSAGGGAAVESDASELAAGSEPGADAVVDPEQEAKAGSTALPGGGAVEVEGQAAGPMYSDEPESEGAHGEFQGNESGAMCTSGEDSDSGQAQPVAEAAKAAEVVEIPKGLQEFFDAPSYEFGEDGRVLGAAPEANGLVPNMPGPSSEMTATELNQIVATLQDMSSSEREAFLVATGRRGQNPATVIFQMGVFLETMAG